MRTSRRSLVLILTALLSLGAVPAGAADDGPDLLGDLAKTVAPAPVEPKAEPVLVPALPLAAPVEVVSDTLRVATEVAPALAGAVESLVPQPKASRPAAGSGVPSVSAGPAPTQQLASSNRTFAVSTGRAAASTLGDRVLSVALGSSAVAASQAGRTASIQRSDLDSATSTLPDGGSPLTLTWFVLCAGLMAAGSLVLRRSRTPR